MKKSQCFLSIALALFSLSTARATSVIPPSFDELVAEAEVIFQGRVTDVRSQWAGEGGQRHILTYVTFSVEDALKGTPGQSYTIRMLGGTIAGETMEVADAPRFQVGDRDILFVEHNGSQFIPLVGIMHGRFHLHRDQGGNELVRTNEGHPVVDLAKLGHGEQPAAAGNGMSVAEFKSAVRAKLDARRNGGQ